MAEPKPYKPTLFDRHGPEAADYMRAAIWAVAAFFLFAGALVSSGGAGWKAAGAIGLVAALVAFFLPLFLSGTAGWMVKRFAVDGTSTPYAEQYSYQQALVMQGRLDDALASYEGVITEKPDAVEPRLRAAELYDRNLKNHRRAAELFREVQRIESVAPGQFVLATNRLVDLYLGPLDEPGKALVELRRLIDRYPGSPAADHARSALATLKERHRPG